MDAKQIASDGSVVALTGATGYVGRPLARRLAAAGLRVRALARDPGKAASVLPPSCELVRGDLRDPDAARRLVETGCDVVNLAYLWDAAPQENLQALRCVLAACEARGARRLVHLSSVAVYGRSPGDRVDERSLRRPVVPYGKTKLALERLLAEECRTAYAIVQPATVFGEAGPPLDKLLAELRRPLRIGGYLMSSLSAKRRMNLVHVDNVVEAIVFLLEVEPLPRGESFIVSDDDDPANNFHDVEAQLMANLNVPDYSVPRVPVPEALLRALLCLRGHNNVNPRRVFDGSRLAALGYRRRVTLAQGLAALTVR